MAGNSVRYNKKAFSPLSDKEIRIAMRTTAREASVPIFQQHFNEGQSSWKEPTEAYKKRKGGKPKFVNTGQAKKAIDSVKHRYKKVRVSRRGKLFKASVALYRMKDGHNIYTLAQKGKIVGEVDDMEISAVRPGDDAVVTPMLADAMIKMLTEKGLLK